jgi:hypothetical protein
MPRLFAEADCEPIQNVGQVVFAFATECREMVFEN